MFCKLGYWALKNKFRALVLFVEGFFRDTETRIELLEERIEDMAETIDSLKQEVADLQAQADEDSAEFDAVVTQVNGQIATLEQQVADLQAQIGSGTVVSQQDLDTIGTGLQGVKESLGSLKSKEDAVLTPQG